MVDASFERGSIHQIAGESLEMRHLDLTRRGRRRFSACFVGLPKTRPCLCRTQTTLEILGAPLSRIYTCLGLTYSFVRSPWVILNDFGGAFAMGAIGGGIWHGIKGSRNSPRVCNLRNLDRWLTASPSGTLLNRWVIR